MVYLELRPETPPPPPRPPIWRRGAFPHVIRASGAVLMGVGVLGAAAGLGGIILLVAITLPLEMLNDGPSQPLALPRGLWLLAGGGVLAILIGSMLAGRRWHTRVILLSIALGVACFLTMTLIAVVFHLMR